jgi:glucosyl-dolichyl phosphate glucuronosyltransferase
VVTEFANTTSVRYIREERVGLCIARNRGWRSALAPIVAFLDDDAIALPGWLSAIRNAFAAGNGDVIVGGPVEPIWETPRPSWLEEEIARSLTIVDWGPSDKIITDLGYEWLVGANMAIPKSLLWKVNGFHPWLDRVGSNLLSSGDVFLQKQLVRLGCSCMYVRAMRVQHHVPATRLNHHWFIRRFYWQGVSDAVMYLIEATPTATERFRTAVARAVSLFRSSDSISSLVFTADNPKAFTAKCFALIELGYIAGLLGAARH